MEGDFGYDAEDRVFKIGDYLHNQWSDKYYKIVDHLYDYNGCYFTIWDLNEKRLSRKVWLFSDKDLEDGSTIFEFIIINQKIALKGVRDKKIRRLLGD